jgi:DNA-binding NtrC family response regulator
MDKLSTRFYTENVFFKYLIDRLNKNEDYNIADINLVIIDVMMPELSGRDCFNEMKTINSCIKAIISTGNGPNHTVEAFLKDDASDFIHKPFNKAKLSQVVAKVPTPAQNQSI